MNKKDIVDAWAWVRKNNQAIPDDVLDLMKDAAIEKLASHTPEVKRYWEIIEYRMDFMQSKDVSFTLANSGDYATGLNGRFFAFSKDYFIEEKAPIHSVRRLSDGVVFSVGDEITNSNEVIESLEIDGNHIKAWVVSGGFYILAQITKPERTKLFTTEDGHDIFDPEEMLYYVSNFRTIERKAKNMVNMNNKRFRIFSAAENHVLMNKPLLSVNNILSRFSGKWGECTEVSLRDLAKSKSNQ